MIRTILALWAVCLLAACSGGGGGGTPTSTPTGGATTPPSGGGTTPVVNFATVTLDAGPAELNVGPGAYTAFNEPYVTIKICAPG